MIDSNEAAERVGTTPRVLRAFLRSKYSTFQAVGSGARYEFTESDIPTLVKRFNEWKGDGKPKSSMTNQVAKRKVSKPPQAEIQRERDLAVWAEEGCVELEDIRDPRVRARVLAEARAAELKIEMLLMAKGMHITQVGDRR